MHLFSSPIRTTYPAHLILLDLITLIMLGEEYEFSFSSFFIVPLFRFSSVLCLYLWLSSLPYFILHFFAFLSIHNYFTIYSVFPSLSLYLNLFYYIPFPPYFFLIFPPLSSVSLFLSLFTSSLAGFNFVFFLLVLFISSCHAVAQEVSWRLPNSMAQVRSQVAWDSWWTTCQWGRFSPGTSHSIKCPTFINQRV
jgi:hypothetical protein